MAPEPVQKEYDFVEEPPPEYFCPVTYELLSDPQQTRCCGNLLSGEVVSRLQREGKACPLCSNPSFTVTDDKHFKRKANELKVRCPHKRNGCEWVGELGNSDQHSNSCPKRPWQCKHCDFEGIYDVGTSDHLPNCTKYPEPCPNRCDIGTVPRYDMGKHLTQCPLQLVECEFAQAGCQVRLPRRVLARHVEEEGQRHLLSMSLLNLGLTRELHQKMAEKDQQIAELQEQLQQQSSKLEKQFQEIKDLQKQCKQTDEQLELGFSGIRGEIQKLDVDLRQKIQQQAKQIAGVHEQLQQKLTGQRMETEKQITGVHEQLQQKLTGQQMETEKQITGVHEQLEQKLTGLQTLLQNENEMLRKTLQQQVQEQGKQIHDSLCVLRGFSPPFKTTLTKFSVHRAGGVHGRWKSDPFYSHTGGYKFLLGVDTNGWEDARGTHITADFISMNGEYDDNLSWPIQITAHLQLLNQRGDHGHMVATLNRRGVGKATGYIEIARKFIAHSELEYNAEKNTEYLKEDCLCFQLYLKVDPQTY